MNASDAQQISNDAVKKEMDRILSKIEAAAKKGQNSVSVGGFFNKMIPIACIRQLEASGFKYCARNSTIFW